MKNERPEATSTPEADSTSEPGIGSKALALAGFAETSLTDDPTTIISPHGGVLTWTVIGY